MTYSPKLSEIRFFCMILLPLSRTTHGVMTEGEIIEEAKRSNWLTREELSSVRSRSDSRFANKVHNVVCHRDSARNPIRLGLIKWDHLTASFSLTERGKRFLSCVAFQLNADVASASGAIQRWLRTGSK